MPVSKQRSKKRLRKFKKKRPQTARGMVFMKNALSNIPPEALLKGLIEVGKSHQDEFPIRFQEVLTILRSVDPLLTISMLATYGLMGGVDDSGNVSSGYKGEEFNQSHVELVQALYLRIPLSECSLVPPSPDVIQKLFDLLPQLGNAFGLMRYTQLQKERSEQDKAVLMIQERLRLHTQGVRNWGFLSHVERITKHLCDPLDEVFIATVGIRSTSLIDLFSHLIDRHERLTNSRFENLRPVFHEHTIAGMIDVYHKAYPYLKDTTAEMRHFVDMHGVTLDQMKSLILSHSDLSLVDAHTFDVRTLASETGIEEKSITSVLDHLSYGFGELAENNPEHFFLTNPIWTKPIIKLEGNRYFCAMPQMFFSFVFQVIADLLKGYESASKQYVKRRAKFLETEITDMFGKAFPDCEIMAGYRWQEESDEYENDLMVRVDSHLILVEAKSNSISWSALRGGPDRARRHVEEMYLAPSIQSLRLANRITKALANKDKSESLLPEFPISLNQVKTVLRLSVTLEDFATFQTTLHYAKKANWIPLDHPVAPCILLSDLKIVFDVLESTPHKIHYLKRRADLESHFDYAGDELDLLGFYLKSGFNIGEAEYSGHHFMLLTMSTSIDNYYKALEEGIVTSKPVPKMTIWWKDICTKIEERGFHQWSDIANVLLSVSLEDQEAMAKKFKEMSKNVHKNWRVPNHNCAIVMVPHKMRNDALAIIAFKERDKDKRHIRMENVAADVFEGSHVERCLVIGVNIDKMHYPYSLIAIFFRSGYETAA